MNYRFLSLLGSLCGLMLLQACSRSVILLSPEDLFALGDHYMENDEFRDAGEQYQRIRDEYPTSQFATMSQFKLAEAEYNRGNYDEAAVEFSLFLEFHPGHKLAPQAQYFIALSKFHSLPSPERDTTLAHDALKELEEFLRRYTDHPDYHKVTRYRIEVIDHLQLHEIQVARVYFRRGDYEAARLRLLPIPDTEASPNVKQEALYWLGRVSEKENDRDAAQSYFRQAGDAGSNERLPRRSSIHLNGV
ncbi:outer membrane protein assembly factor BamD [bacterium]|nr:outer membrane protein assembly factor BamD [candidate division CSSED10-310 bacterium]